MKLRTFFWLSIFSLSASLQADSRCLFGESLTETARFKHFKSSEEISYQSKDRIPADIKPKIKIALPFEGNTFWIRKLTDTNTGKVYDLILSDPGDNMAGGIIDGETRVATISDGYINECTVNYDCQNNRLFKQPGPSNRHLTEDYFGRSPADLERIAQFKISPRKKDEHHEKRCYGSGNCAASRAKYLISDLMTQQEYYLDLDDKKDGLIVTKEAPHFIVAKISGGIYTEQAASFFLWDELPWFYTN